MQLRLATLDDAEEMRTIYNLEVETSTATFDLVTRSLEDQRAWLAERSGAHAAVVAVNDGDVVGFASLSPYKERAAYRTTVEDSVYVRRDHHGQGIGKALLGEMLDVARRHGFHAVMARIEATATRRSRCTARAGSSWSASSVRSGGSSTAGSTSR